MNHGIKCSDDINARRCTNRHIKQWNHASDDWHTIEAENDLRVGGKFRSPMEAKDQSMGFDFEGVYEEVEVNELI